MSLDNLFVSDTILKPTTPPRQRIPSSSLPSADSKACEGIPLSEQIADIVFDNDRNLSLSVKHADLTAIIDMAFTIAKYRGTNNMKKKTND
jgi:hypothetical protein